MSEDADVSTKLDYNVVEVDVNEFAEVIRAQMKHSLESLSTKYNNSAKATVILEPCPYPVFRTIFDSVLDLKESKTKKIRGKDALVNVEVIQVARTASVLLRLFGKDEWWKIPSYVSKTSKKLNGTFSGVGSVKVSYYCITGGKLVMQMNCELRNMYGSLQ